jgi:hypothetical protein
MARSNERRSPALVTKLSVSLQPEQAAWLRARARKDRRALSAVLGDAVAEAQRREAQQELLAWLTAESGPVTEAERDAVRRELGSARTGRRARRSA